MTYYKMDAHGNSGPVYTDYKTFQCCCLAKWYYFTL